MKLVIAYIRTECAAHVMRDLYEAGGGGITCYMVHGIRSEKPTFLYSTRPFEVHHLPAALKLEMICSEDSVDDIVSLIARTAQTGIAAMALSRCRMSKRYRKFAISKRHRDGVTFFSRIH